MNKIIISLTILILLSCAGQIKESEKQTDLNDELESFEGKITYDIEIEYMDTNSPVDYSNYYENVLHGSSAIYSYGEKGSILREYPHSGIGGFKYKCFNLNENTSFWELRNYDTLYIENPSSNNFELISKAYGDSLQICGYDCQTITYTVLDPIWNDIIIYRYYYSKEIYLEPTRYVNWKEALVGEIFGIMKSPILGSDIDYGTYKKHMRAIKVESEKIDESIFTIPSNIPIVEY